jgi:FlaA1/EpsC-like NDP-sugar epimerase
MIRLSGHEPDVDIPIVFSGIRPGEKFFEEILGAEEGTVGTRYDKIYIARNSNKVNEGELLAKIEALINLSFEKGGKESIKKLLQEIVPTYRMAEDLLWKPEEKEVLRKKIT